MRPGLGCALLVALALISQTTRAEPRTLTVQEATALAGAAVRDRHDESERLPGFELDPNSYEDPPGFLTIEAMWRGACAACGSALAHFEVNMKDADIYDPISFKEIKSASVRRFQKKLRERIGLSRILYMKYKAEDKTICWYTVDKPSGPLVCPH